MIILHQMIQLLVFHQFIGFSFTNMCSFTNQRCDHLFQISLTSDEFPPNCFSCKIKQGHVYMEHSSSGETSIFQFPSLSNLFWKFISLPVESRTHLVCKLWWEWKIENSDLILLRVPLFPRELMCLQYPCAISCKSKGIPN